MPGFPVGTGTQKAAKARRYKREEEDAGLSGRNRNAEGSESPALRKRKRKMPGFPVGTGTQKAAKARRYEMRASLAGEIGDFGLEASEVTAGGTPASNAILDWKRIA